MTLDMCGTGTMAGYCRSIPIPDVQTVMDSSPRVPGQPVQSFDTDMFAMQGQLPPGDPDFDLLRITAGSGFGMPSPGHTTLIRESPTLPHRYAVDSFFDITYRIDFVGKPGGPLGGMSGSTTGTIRMTQGLPAVTPTPTATATATNTATATPTPINHSITVLKLNDTTGLPMSGWTMNLYSGAGCQGTAVATQVTDSNGIVDFTNLSAGSYSVGEVNQVGWTPMSGVCQDTALTGRSSGGSAVGGYASGDDNFVRASNFKVELSSGPGGGGGGSSVTATGPSLVHRSEPCAGCLPNGGDMVQTEMLSMDLQGSSVDLGTIHLRESPSRPSLGQIRQQTPGVDYPADSFFDIFFEVDLASGTTLHNEQPLRATATLSDGTSRNNTYSTGCSPIPLLDSNNQPAGAISCLALVALYPDETFIVFRNQPPAPTATNTATPTATPTNTPSDCIAPDNGSNTVDLPAPCRLFGGPMSMINGLPPGEPVDFAVSLDTFTNVVRTPGGSLGGEEDSASASLTLRYKGWDGTIKGRPFTAEARFSHGPRQTTSFTQDFASEISRLQGQLPPGDPDFDLLRVTAGSDFGLPSPGHTTLIRESPTLPRWSVDSFFDITYRIDFVGKPGGHYGGMSGSTTGTIRVYQNSSGPRPPADCLQDENGSGTIDMPAPCPYAGWPVSVFDGLPPGASIQADMLLDGLANVITLPGGPPGGERKGYEYYQARSDLQAAGLQTNPAYHRAITFPSLQMVVDLAPRTPGDPVQSFDTEMVSMQGQLPPGDPDFDLLRITAGSSFGLPSPGHTTLRLRESPTLPHRYTVDSFFDITYRIDFVGRAGGPFGGMSGSTTGTIRMQQGIPGSGQNTPTSTPTNTATNTPTPTATATATYTPTPVYNTQTGTNVVVHSAASDASAGFSVVTSPGDTTFTPISPNSAGEPPSGYFLCPTCPAYDIATTAVYTPPIEVCLSVPTSLDDSHFTRMRLLHGENGVLVDITTRRVTNPDSSRLVCGTTSHFSPFVMAEVAAITGTVTYGNPVTGTNPRGVPNVLISGAGSPALSDTTGAPGTYVLTGFGAGSYTITPSKSGGVNGAITSFDAAKISQFVTGATTFTAAQLAVADVTAFGGVTSFDAALIARYAASLGSPTGNSGTWFFSPSSVTHTSITSDILGEDYSALLMGDVSGNWGDPSSFRFGFGPERSTAVAAANIAVKPEGDVLIPISVQGAANKGIISYQFDLRYDPAVIQPQANAVDLDGTVSRGFAVVVNAVQPGLLRVVVYGPIEIDSNGVLLNLRFKAVGYPGTVSPLTWEGILFNEGDPHATMTDGQVEILN